MKELVKICLKEKKKTAEKKRVGIILQYEPSFNSIRPHENKNHQEINKKGQIISSLHNKMRGHN